MRAVSSASHGRSTTGGEPGPMIHAWPAPLALLLGPEAPGLLTAALDGYGGRLLRHRVATVGVQPGGGTVVQYLADVERADGRRTRETLAAATGGRIPRGAAVLAGEYRGATVEVGMWRWPQDPALPALAAAADPARLGELLRAAGMPREGTPQVRMRAYRPGRRAVLEITGGGPRLYAKVVRPHTVDDLRRRHDLLAGALPVPPVAAAGADGLLVSPELPGTPLRALLADDGPLPAPTTLESVLDRLPATLTSFPARRSHLERVGHFADVLALTLPAERARVEDLAASLAAVDGGGQPIVPVHGDFYEAQLLSDEGAVTGLLDLDTAGPGHRIDEWATLLAHLSVIAPHLEPARGYGATVLAHAERRFPRSQLRPRITAAVLGLATGPFRVQQADWERHTRARLDLAERWSRG